MSIKLKEKYNISDLLDIMELLRSPQGCPWDKEQTHESIRSNFIEETYEVIEAIDKKDVDNLKEELGDVLLQVVFHSQIEKENSSFDFSDVTNDICQKLIIRHPHIFSDTKVSGTDDVLSNWDKIKQKTKNQKSQSESMVSVPMTFPALMRSTKIQAKAAKAGFDWSDVSGALSKVHEETAELIEAIHNNDMALIEDELGDLLFSVVNVSRFVKVDAEEALTKASNKFIKRFTEVENLAKERNINMTKSSLQELDKLWDEVKQNNK